MPATGSVNSPTGKRLRLPEKWIVEDLNRFLRGWAAYFRFGNSAATSRRSASYARNGWPGSVASATTASARVRPGGGHLPVPGPVRADHLVGIVITPRPFRAWRAPAECRR